MLAPTLCDQEGLPDYVTPLQNIPAPDHEHVFSSWVRPPLCRGLSWDVGATRCHGFVGATRCCEILRVAEFTRVLIVFEPTFSDHLNVFQSDSSLLCARQRVCRVSFPCACWLPAGLAKWSCQGGQHPSTADRAGCGRPQNDRNTQHIIATADYLIESGLISLQVGSNCAQLQLRIAAANGGRRCPTCSCNPTKDCIAEQSQNRDAGFPRSWTFV